MKNTGKLRLNHLLLVLLLVTGSAWAQTQQKVKKSYPVKKDVAITVEAQHTKLLIETWDRSEMEIEAFIDTAGLSKEEATKALEAWHVTVRGDRNAMILNSRGSSFGNNFPPIPAMDSLGNRTAEMLGPLMNNLIGPMIQNFSERPPLPPEVMKSVGSIQFDHEAYKRDGEKYLEEWEKEIEAKFGKEFEADMEEWAKSFEKDSEKWAAKMEADMEVWGEQFGKDMEKWAEKFGSEMEVWGEQFGREMEKWAAEVEDQEGDSISRSFSITMKGGSSGANRTMIIRVPESARLDLDVRHGEVQLPETTVNLKATLSHSKLTGNTITGPKTTIDASYTPVKIKNWEYGVLNINYVKNCHIEQARSLKLTSTSSDVKIGALHDTGIIAGTFGNLDILKVSAKFKTLNVSLENSELHLDLPDSAFNFNYTGSQSNLEYPSSIKAEPVKSYDSEIINGYQGSSTGSGVVNIKAEFSDVKVE